MTQQESAPRTDPPALSGRRRGIAVAVAFALAALLGSLGWILPSVGGSVIVPALTVLAVGSVVVVVASWLAGRRAARRSPAGLAAGLMAVTIVASVWTFEYSLPTQIWASGATTQAKAALARLAHSSQDRHGVVPAQPCTEHATGSVGPLPAPYSECAVWTPEGHVVIFRRTGTAPGGLGYTDRGAATLLDSCERHLIANWWMFTESSDADGDPGQCPIGYVYHGGP